MNPKRLQSRLWLVLIVTVSVLLRVAVALYLGDIVDAPSLLTDQRSYHALGSRMISGHGFSFDRAWYPFTPANSPTAHWSFLYSLFIAGIYAVFGVHPLAARVVQAILGGVLLPWVIFRLTRRIFDAGRGSMPSKRTEGAVAPTVAYMAAAIAAVYGYYILYAATLMTETFFIIGVVTSLDLGLDIASRLQQGQALPAWVGLRLGVILGLTTLLRQSILPWILVFFTYLGWLAIQNRRLRPALRFLMTVSFVLLAFVLPWTYRNYIAYDSFLLLNSNTGYAMYSAQHPMHGTSFREFEGAPLPEDLPHGNEAAMDRELMRIGVQFVLDDPIRYVLLSLSRIKAFFEFWPTSDTTLLHNIGRVGSYGLFLPFMLYGLALAHYSTKSGMLQQRGILSLGPQLLKRNMLIFLFVFTYTVMHLLTWAMVRYRLPVDAVMLPWAGLALTDLITRIQVMFSKARSTKQDKETRTKLATSLHDLNGEAE